VIAISTALKNARLESVVAFLQTGTAAATANVYDGVRPALGAVPAGTLLVAIPLPAPVGTVSSGVLTLTPTTDALNAATGQATWARIVNGNGDLAWDCDVSDASGSGELVLTATTLYIGGFTRIVAGTLG
jgi:hypothetical protein